MFLYFMTFQIVNIKIKKIEPNAFIEKLGITILTVCGEGSYGKVYFCKYLDKKHIIKFSNNEDPEILLQRYEILKPICVKHLFCGSVKNEYYDYYSVMEYGGETLKNAEITSKNIGTVIKQLQNICEYICQNTILYTDFKMNNVVIDKNDKVRLIDIYLHCKDCFKNKNCNIIRTYEIPDISILKLHKKSSNQLTYILPLYGFVLLDLTTQGFKPLKQLVCDTLKLKLTTKQFAVLLQLSCFLHLNPQNCNIPEKLKDYLGENLKKHKHLAKIYPTLLTHIECKCNCDKNDLLNHLNGIFVPISELRMLGEFIIQ